MKEKDGKPQKYIHTNSISFPFSKIRGLAMRHGHCLRIVGYSTNQQDLWECQQPTILWNLSEFKGFTEFGLMHGHGRYPSRKPNQTLIFKCGMFTTLPWLLSNSYIHPMSRTFFSFWNKVQDKVFSVNSTECF